jgi:hypothetical protein
VERRKLGIHHDDAVVADHNKDVAALAFEHIGLPAKIGGLDLRERRIGPLRPGGAGREHRRSGQLARAVLRLIASLIRLMGILHDCQPLPGSASCGGREAEPGFGAEQQDVTFQQAVEVADVAITA